MTCRNYEPSQVLWEAELTDLLSILGRILGPIPLRATQVAAVASRFPSSPLVARSTHLSNEPVAIKATANPAVALALAVKDLNRVKRL